MIGFVKEAFIFYKKRLEGTKKQAVVILLAFLYSLGLLFNLTWTFLAIWIGIGFAFFGLLLLLYYAHKETEL